MHESQKTAFRSEVCFPPRLFIFSLFFFLWCLAGFRLWAQKHIPQSHLLSWNRNAGITDVHHHIWLLIWALGSKLRLWSSVASMFTRRTIHFPDHGGPILNESPRQFLWVLECVIFYAFCKSRSIQSCWSGLSIRADKKYLSKSILFFSICKCVSQENQNMHTLITY